MVHSSSFSCWLIEVLLSPLVEGHPSRNFGPSAFIFSSRGQRFRNYFQKFLYAYQKKKNWKEKQNVFFKGVFWSKYIKQQFFSVTNKSPASALVLEKNNVCITWLFLHILITDKKKKSAVICCVRVCVCVCDQWCLILCNPMDCQTPLSMQISKQEYWNELPFPIPGDLPNPGIKPLSLASSSLAGGFFTIVPPGKSVACCFCL